jgi:hypothetical protein
LVWEKSPLAEIVLMLRGELPALIKVTGSGLLLMLRDWFPKSIDCGLSATAGASTLLILTMKALLLEALPA